MNDLNSVVVDFIESAINDGIAQEEGNANQSNKCYRRIEKRIKWLTEHGELGNAMFLELLNHRDDYVKYHTACALLHEKEDMAIDTLKVISEKKGILGFSAKMTISEYEKGHI